jgi:hypothetical protein
MIVKSVSYDHGSKLAPALELDCRPLATSVAFGKADGRDIEVQERLLEADREGF